jgi:hypothetical protein
MSLDETRIMTFGDVRRSILNDIAAVRNKTMTVAEAGAVGALYKELHTNIQVEINAAKMALATEGKAHAFGKLVGMGQRLIGSDGVGAD